MTKIEGYKKCPKCGSIAYMLYHIGNTEHLVICGTCLRGYEEVSISTRLIF